jgi:uncharacterized membrane protein
MTTKKFRWIRLGIVLGLGLAVGVGTTLKIVLIPLIAIPAALAVVIILGLSVKDRVKDERLVRLANAAARWSFSVFGIAASALGAVLVALGGTYSTTWWVGLSLSISVCILLLLYLCFYFIFTRKY